MHSTSMHSRMRLPAPCIQMVCRPLPALPDLQLSPLRPPWSAPCRFVMWAHATPVMLYTLSLISDFTSKQARTTCVCLLA